MKVDPKKVKKLDKLLTKIYAKCDKKRYTKIPDTDLKEVLALIQSVQDKSQIMYLYTNYKTFISDNLLREVETILGISNGTKKEPVKRQELSQVQQQVVKSEPKMEIFKYVDNFGFKPYEELPEHTKEVLESLKRNGFLFKVAKTYKKLDSFEDDQERKTAEDLCINHIVVHWVNDELLYIEVGTEKSRMKVLDAVRKYKDNPEFMMKLNLLLGLSIYTPASAYSDEFKINVTYVDDNTIERVKVYENSKY